MKEISSIEEFNDHVMLSEKYVVIDFYANWCNPCKRLMPYLEENVIPELSKLGVDIYKIKAYEDDYSLKQKTILGDFYVTGKIPFLVVFKNKKIVLSLEGTEKCKTILEELKKIM